ncbi:MAG: hypothetical protein AAF799_11770 [Myxococcota bacterium]
MFSLLPLLFALAGPGQLLSNPEAQAKFQEAQDAFKAQDFAAAAAAVEAAYLIEPKPMLLYPWAQAERSQGNCEAAVQLYRRFLDSEPPEQLVGPATENMDRCQEEIDAAEEVEIIDDDDDEVIVDDDEDELEPEPEPEEEVVPPPKVEDDEPKAKAWYLDPVGGALSGAGVVGIGVGIGLLAVASSSARGASDLGSHSEYLAERDRATSLRNGGAAALSIGVALAAGGAVRYFLVARKNKQDETAWQMTPQVGRRWTGVTIGRRF